MENEKSFIGVVIPVYNEEQTIATCLDQFTTLPGGWEVIVVDGGSTDQTTTQVQRFADVHLLHSPERGRGVQANYGAQASTSPVLLFLHADTLLPHHAFQLITTSLIPKQVVGGRFHLRLSSSEPVYRTIALFSNLRSGLLGITYGDQGIYLRRSVFEQLGGFPPIPLFEDSELCKRASRLGKFDFLPAPVTTSGRRWQKQGVARTILRMWALRLLYACAISPHTLARYYRPVR